MLMQPLKLAVLPSYPSDKQEGHNDPVSLNWLTSRHAHRSCIQYLGRPSSHNTKKEYTNSRHRVTTGFLRKTSQRISPEWSKCIISC